MDEAGAIAKHRAYGKEIRMLLDLRSYLIQQVHEKLCKRAVIKYKLTPEHEALKPYYDKILFMGRSEITTFSVFPSVFKCVMEDVFAMEAPEFAFFSDDFTSVYYKHTDNNTFDPAEWLLVVDSPSGDIPLIRRYRNLLLDFMERAVEEATKVGHKSVKKLKRELDRYKTITTGL